MGLSTAAFVVQNISRKRSLGSCTLYWSSVRPRCVMILVSEFLDLASDLLDLQKSMLANCHPRELPLCCALLFSLSCLNAANACSSVHGTLTCGSCPGTAAATCASSA